MRFYGLGMGEIEGMLMSELASFIYAMNVLLVEETHRWLNIISYPHMNEGARRRLLAQLRNVSGVRERQMGDARSMALKYHRHVRRKDQPWPKPLSKN